MKTKQENNRLIAEFMGFTQGKADEIRFREDWFDNNGVINGQRNVHLHFDTSWDWLMPVVEKILDLELSGVDEYDDYITTLQHYLQWVELDNVYDTVVNFINWYNSQKPLSS